jgi:hypothetical protein
MPVKARQYTRTYMVVREHEGNGGNAYSAGADTVFQDAADGGVRSPTVAIHEMAHTVDFGWNQIHNQQGWVSSESGFIDAINGDTCVPDGYAKSDDIEDFAQLAVLSSYDKNAGPLSKYKDPSCLKNQLNFVESTIGVTSTPGGVCDFTWARDDKVCMGPEAGCSTKRAEKARRVPVNGIPVLETPKITKRTQCESIHLKYSKNKVKRAAPAGEAKKTKPFHA